MAHTLQRVLNAPVQRHIIMFKRGVLFKISSLCALRFPCQSLPLPARALKLLPAWKSVARREAFNMLLNALYSGALTLTAVYCEAVINQQWRQISQ